MSETSDYEIRSFWIPDGFEIQLTIGISSLLSVSYFPTGPQQLRFVCTYHFLQEYVTLGIYEDNMYINFDGSSLTV